MPRILCIVNSLNAGGAERSVVSLMNHLDLSEFPAVIAYLHTGDALLNELGASRRAGAMCCHASGRIDHAATRRLSDTIDREQIDVIFCTNMYAMLYGWMARRGARRKPKLIVAYHTTLLGTWRLRFHMAFYWSIIRRCDHLVYVCMNQRDHWRRAGLRARSESVIYNGIDVEHYDPNRFIEAGRRLRGEIGCSDSDLVVGICAGLRREKAHGDLLQALARVRNKGLRVKCIIIGDGPERAAIEARVGELNLSKDVKMAGFQTDVRPWIAACDIMAIVSHSIETFSLSALESMAMEKPMVMSRIGGADEQVDDGRNGWLFRAGDIDKLADLLMQCNDLGLRRATGIRARATVVEKFNITDMTRQYADLFRALA